MKFDRLAAMMLCEFLQGQLVHWNLAVRPALRYFMFHSDPSDDQLNLDQI